MPPSSSKAQTGPKRVKPTRNGPARAPELLFLDEVCAELRVSLATVKRMIKTGELGSMKVAGQRRVSRFDLNSYYRAARREARREAQASLREVDHELNAAAKDLVTSAQRALALCQACEGGSLTVRAPNGRYADVLIVAAQGAGISAADVARTFDQALEFLGGGALPPAPPAANGVQIDPRQAVLPLDDAAALESSSEDLEDEPGLLESDVEELLAEEEEAGNQSAEERAAAREGDPQYEPFDPYPERL